MGVDGRKAGFVEMDMGDAQVGGGPRVVVLVGAIGWDYRDRGGYKGQGGNYIVMKERSKIMFKHKNKRWSLRL